ELLAASMYLAIWFDPYFLGEKGFEGLSIALWLDFVFNHAQVGTSIASIFFKPGSTKQKVAVGIASSFYLLFVGGISIATGSYLTAIIFIILSIKRILNSGREDGMIMQLGYSFSRIMILLVCALAGYLLALVLPSPVGDIDFIKKGAEMVPAWGLVYFVSLHFFERWLERKNFGEPGKLHESSRKNKIRSRIV